MKVGLVVPDFSLAGGPQRIAGYIRDMARTADECGYASFWVMDHFFQIGGIGPVEWEMLEGYSALAFAAAVTTRVRLGTMVTGVTYRHPGVLAKTVSTLDVLSGGRAWLGIGAAWFEREHLGLGVPFYTRSERFERLEETLQICHQMWSGEVKPYVGRHFQLAETLDSPAPLTRPRPPILVGGGGERKTLRLVAQYADACNIRPEDLGVLEHKLGVLREHCQRLGRDYHTIEKTSNLLEPELGAKSASELVDIIARLAELGVQHVVFGNRALTSPAAVERIARDVMPQVGAL